MKIRNIGVMSPGEMGQAVALQLKHKGFHHGVTDPYEFVAGTALGRETPETRDKSRSGKDVVRMLADDRSGDRPG